MPKSGDVLTRGRDTWVYKPGKGWTYKRPKKSKVKNVAAKPVPDPEDPCMAHAGCHKCMSIVSGPRASRRRRFRGGRQTPLWIREMRRMDCHYCGGQGGTIDHVIPLSKGGRTKIANCVPACAPCNNYRKDTDYRQFKEIGWKKRPFA